jgi:hypothetical protein
MMKTGSAALLTAALLTACTDARHPTDLAPTETTASVAAAVPTGHAALAPVEDALARVLPELPDHPARQELHSALRALAQALVAGDGCATRANRRDAEHALRDLGRATPTEFEADLEVAKLALEAVDEPGGGRCIR